MVTVKKEEDKDEFVTLKSSTFDNSPLLPVNCQKNSTYNEQGLLILTPKIPTHHTDAITLFLEAILKHPDDLIGDEYIFGYPDALTTDWGIIKEYLIENNEPPIISQVAKSLYPNWCERAHEAYLFCLVRKKNDRAQWPEFVLLWEQLIEKALKEFRKITKNQATKLTESPIINQEQRLRKGPVKRDFENYVTDPSIRFLKKNKKQSIQPEEKETYKIEYDEFGYLKLTPQLIIDQDLLFEFQKLTTVLSNVKYNVIASFFICGYPNLGNPGKLFTGFSNNNIKDPYFYSKFKRIHELYLYYQYNRIRGKRPKCVSAWESFLLNSKTQLKNYDEIMKPVYKIDNINYNKDGLLILTPKYINDKLIDISKKFIDVLIEFGNYSFIKEILLYNDKISNNDKNENLSELKNFCEKISKYSQFGSNIKEMRVVNEIIFRIHSEYLCFKFAYPKLKQKWPDYMLYWDTILNEEQVSSSNDIVTTTTTITKETSLESKIINHKKNETPILTEKEKTLDINEMLDKSIFFASFKPYKDSNKSYWKRNNEYDSNGLLILKPLLKRLPGYSTNKIIFCSILKEYPINLLGFKFTFDYPDIGMKTAGDISKHIKKINDSSNSSSQLTAETLKDLTETIHKVFLYYVYNFPDDITKWPPIAVNWGDIIQRSFVETKLLKKFLECEIEVNGKKYNKDKYLILEPEVMDAAYVAETCVLLLKSLSEYAINIPYRKYVLCEEGDVTYNDWLNFQKFSRIQSQQDFFCKKFNAKEAEELCDKIHKEFLYFKAIHGTNRKNDWPQYLFIWEHLLTQSNSKENSMGISDNFTFANNNSIKASSYTNTNESIVTDIPESPIKQIANKNSILSRKEEKYVKKKTKKLKKNVKILKHNIREMKKKHKLDILTLEKSVEANNLIFRSKLKAKDLEIEELKKKMENNNI
ncbi:hypothetical protein ACO0SA_000435 [Hanseniaspora valbyensis]